MRSATLFTLMLLVTPIVAQGDSFRERLNAANDLLRKGDLEAALSAYRDLQVDDPESPELYYNIGCARYEEALKGLSQSARAEDKQPFEEARASFEKAIATGAGELRRDAAFNCANCLAQVAKNVPKDTKQDEILKAYEESIKTYEDVLRQYPDHEGARKNLDHMRYLLKKMLQNPPPPQEQQQGGGEQEPQKDQQQEKKDEQPQPQPEQQQDQPSQSSEKPDEQKLQKQNQEQPQQAQQNQGDEDPKQPEPEPMKEGQQEQPKEDQGQAQAAPNAPDRQTVEALLQSLDDRDRMEQRSERREPRSSKVRGDWW